jgi:hypothetical protein
VCDARRRRACPFHARLEPARCSTHRPGRSSRALSEGHRIRCLPRRRAHLDGACRDNASCLRFSSEATLASSSSMVPRRAAPIACLRASHQPRARRSLRTKSGSPGADGRRSSSRRQAIAPAGALLAIWLLHRWAERIARASPTGPLRCAKKSLPGPKQKSTCKFDSSARSVGTRICRDVFQKDRRGRAPVKRPFPANRAKPTPGLEPGTPSLRVKRV